MTINDSDDAPREAAADINSAFAQSSSMMEFDPGRYMAEVADFDITDAQKDELLRTLWSIMRACVELGFQFDVCGHLFKGEPAALLDRVEWPLPKETNVSPDGEGKRIV